MTLYEVQYTKNDWSTDRNTTRIVASSVIKAAEHVGKKNGKFVGYGGRVTQVSEVFSSVHVVK